MAGDRWQGATVVGGSRIDRQRRVPGYISYTQFSVTRTAWHSGAPQTFHMMVARLQIWLEKIDGGALGQICWEGIRLAAEFYQCNSIKLFFFFIITAQELVCQFFLRASEAKFSVIKYSKLHPGFKKLTFTNITVLES